MPSYYMIGGRWMGLSYSLCQFTNYWPWACKPILVYRIFPSYASSNAFSTLGSCVISVFLNKSKTSNFKAIKSPPVRWTCGYRWCWQTSKVNTWCLYIWIFCSPVCVWPRRVPRQNGAIMPNGIKYNRIIKNTKLSKNHQGEPRGRPANSTVRRGWHISHKPLIMAVIFN